MFGLKISTKLKTKIEGRFGRKFQNQIQRLNIDNFIDQTPDIPLTIYALR